MKEVVLSACLSKYAGLYNTKLTACVEAYRSLSDLYSEWSSDHAGIEPQELQPLLERSWQREQLEAMDRALQANEIQSVVLTDAAYPTFLKEIVDPPYVLFYKGGLSLLETNIGLSCVGTRSMSAYGRRAIQNLIGGLKGQAICVVSGLALGVDAEVHRVALASELVTAAVLGGGLDRYEPVTNYRLGEQIAVSGCIMSEYPPGVRPQKHHFLERNRIIAGLSRATVVIEGKEHSGSLVTARYALAFGREVGVVPGDIFAPSSIGPHRLLRDGAWPITQSNDILAMLGVTEASKVDDEASSPVYAALKQRACTIDELVGETGLPLTEVQQQLTLLELDGCITTTATGAYCLT